MKKFIYIVVAFLVVFLIGCSKEESVRVFSFSGEDDILSVHNGVIILNVDKEIFHGGELKIKSDDIKDIRKFSTSFYITGSTNKRILVSNVVSDETKDNNVDLKIDKKLPSIASEKLDISSIDKLKSNLYFELKTEDNNGEEKIYILKLKVEEIE